MNERNPGEPLTAPLAEQLGTKALRDEEREAEKHADDARDARLERKKVEEREAAIFHAEQPIPERARRSWRPGRWQLVAAGALAAGLLLALVGVARSRR